MTGATIDIAIWSTTEQGLAITAGSLATLRPLFRLAASGLGLSNSAPSGIVGSGQRVPSAHRDWDQNACKGSSRHRGPFSLTTLMYRDEEQADVEPSKSADSEPGQPNNALDKKRASLWKSSRGDAGDSEEELTEGSLKQVTWDDRQVKVLTTRCPDGNV